MFAVSCGRSFTTCVTMDGELFAWGVNVHGECGIGATASKGVLGVRVRVRVRVRACACVCTAVVCASVVG